jgi:hypothetical protein
MAKLGVSASWRHKEEEKDEQGVPSPAPARTREGTKDNFGDGKKELKVLVDDVDDKQWDLG